MPIQDIQKSACTPYPFDISTLSVGTTLEIRHLEVQTIRRGVILYPPAETSTPMYYPLQFRSKLVRGELPVGQSLLESIPSHKLSGLSMHPLGEAVFKSFVKTLPFAIRDYLGEKGIPRREATTEIHKTPPTLSRDGTVSVPLRPYPPYSPGGPKGMKVPMTAVQVAAFQVNHGGASPAPINNTLFTVGPHDTMRPIESKSDTPREKKVTFSLSQEQQNASISMQSELRALRNDELPSGVCKVRPGDMPWANDIVFMQSNLPFDLPPDCSFRKRREKRPAACNDPCLGMGDEQDQNPLRNINPENDARPVQIPHNNGNELTEVLTALRETTEMFKNVCRSIGQAFSHFV